MDDYQKEILDVVVVATKDSENWLILEENPLELEFVRRPSEEEKKCMKKEILDSLKTERVAGFEENLVHAWQDFEEKIDEEFDEEIDEEFNEKFDEEFDGEFDKEFDEGLGHFSNSLEAKTEEKPPIEIERAGISGLNMDEEQSFLFLLNHLNYYSQPVAFVNLEDLMAFVKDVREEDEEFAIEIIAIKNPRV